MNRWRRFGAGHGLDGLVVLLAAAVALTTATRDDSSRPDGWLLVAEVAAVAGMVLLLLQRRRAPFVVPAITWLVSAGLSFADGRLISGQAPVSIAGMVAAVLLGNQREAARARVGLVVVVVCAAAVVYQDPSRTVGSQLFVPVLFAVGWLVGFALHERTEQSAAAEQRATRAELERETLARVAVAEERARIARELHDVVAHALSVMVLQVGAVRHRMSGDTSGNREALENVEHAGRTALAEMRRLLDAMRRADDEAELAPQPGLDMLDRMVADIRAAGLEVSLHKEGGPVELPPALDLSAYRILQEGLTNVLKHAGAGRAEVTIRHDPRRLHLEINDDGRGMDTSHDAGYGLLGIRERVKIYSGTMTTGANAVGGFSLCVELPLSQAVHP